MKKTLFILFSLMVIHLHAQDVIVKKDDSTILAKVLEVDETNIKYKKYSNQTGPTYTISITNVRAINYQNGEKDTFDNANPSTPAPASTSSSIASGYIEKPADARNAEIIASYNRDFNRSTQTLKKLNPKKEAKYFVGFTGVAKSSIMSNDEAEMTFVESSLKNPYWASDYYETVYYINVKNKTDKTIYVDLGNSFIIYPSGSFYCYYNPTETQTVTLGGSSGAGLGLGSVAGVLGIGGAVGQLAGGVSVGGSRSHSVSTTYSEQRIIAIPPQGNRNLTTEKWVQTKKVPTLSFSRDEFMRIGHSEDLICGCHKTGQKQGEKYVCSNDSSYSKEFLITYSTSENFSTFSTLKARIYGRMSFGVKFWRKKDTKFIAVDGEGMGRTIYKTPRSW
jgi:hypothetical protein